MRSRIAGRAARCFAAATLAAASASAETAWVKDELRLNLRSGPGNEYRIKGFIKTGDSVSVLSHREGWVQVRSSSELGDGWIEDGFLSPEPPAKYPTPPKQPRRGAGIRGSVPPCPGSSLRGGKPRGSRWVSRARSESKCGPPRAATRPPVTNARSAGDTAP